MNSYKILAYCMLLTVSLPLACVPVADSLDHGYIGYIGYDNGICSRGGLHQMVADYFAALTAHNPAQLPLAASVKYTENGKVMALGAGLWQNASGVRFTRSAIDIERCGVHSVAVLSGGGKDIIYGVRLQIVDNLINEIETYIVHNGDYFFLFSPDGLMASDNDSFTEIHWEGIVPEGRRSTREVLNNYADAYFSSFSNSKMHPPIKEKCYRFEDGMQTTFGDCSFGIISIPGVNNITQRRYPITDVEAGIAIGYVLFGDRVDFHMFKVFDNKVHLISAVLGSAGHSSTGW